MVMKDINYGWTSEVPNMYMCFDSIYLEFPVPT